MYSCVEYYYTTETSAVLCTYAVDDVFSYCVEHDDVDVYYGDDDFLHDVGECYLLTGGDLNCEEGENGGDD